MNENRARAALEQYIEELQNDFYTWYYRQMKSNGQKWHFWSYASIFSGIIASAVTGISNLKFAFLNSYAQTLTLFSIFIPLIGTCASAVLMHRRYQEIFKLRESGREAIQYLISEGKRLAAISTSEDACSQVHKQLIEEVRKIEQSQSIGFFKSSNLSKNS